MKFSKYLCFLSVVCAFQTFADDTDEALARAIDSRAKQYQNLALKLWNWAEMGYQETRSSEALQAELKQAGFKVDAGVGDMPTAFVASFGEGQPVIGILAEFDALPGLSQQALTHRAPIAGAEAGHACGHHLFGTASTAAAIAVSDWLQRSGTKGTIKVYGTPAEEGGAGKVYMVRDGLFEGVDTVLHWHPGDRNAAGNYTTLANKSAKFRFYGVSSHAAAAPERGRSALDAVEAMNLMANQMREHVPSDTRIHYIITEGGKAPNVVPEFAEVFYYVRSSSAEKLAPIWDRLEAVAKGAAMGTGTRTDWEVIHGAHSILPNARLNQVMHASLKSFGGIQYSPEEQVFANEIYATFENPGRARLGQENHVMPFTDAVYETKASSDVGDVSWVVPTTGLSTATWVAGTPAHSWQAVAAGGTSIGGKGMLLAAKALASTSVRIFKEPSIVVEALQELKKKQGPEFKYVPLLGDRAPPVDYRN